ncbi:mechanosensitive ion channel family protein [Rhizobium sp. NFACC06-2]|uniref:cyclic nucleotide-binding domain-containing protein n=1 Tax=Rhizobium sp. NFACC06-2 TaxID=1566264 RepID=UPI0008765A9B|nr:mechanosensitive ion channel family protein [Rhizobium sp. NFACC06-2]SCY89806.1 Small-conductance mechanosensitive channel [Rhizobium sp. NFACC06-2]
MELASNAAVQLVVLVIVFGVTNWIVFRNSRNLRLLNRIALFILLSAMLYANNDAPFTPATLGPNKVDDISLSIAKAAWWLVGSACLVGFVRIFLIFERQPREARLLQDLIVAIIYVGAFLSIISYVFSVPVGTLVATSGVFAIILGLALQNTLSDVFSGIALNLGRPYSVGDWVALEDGGEGRVVETNWRATHLINGDNDLVTIPNSSLAKSKLVNRSKPDSSHAASLKVRLALSTTPAAAVELMETALRAANHIVRHPPPSVKVTSIDAQGIELELKYRLSSLDKSVSAQNEVFDLTFRHAKAAGVMLADARDAPARAERTAEPQTPHPGTAWRLLNALPLLESLTDDEKEVLSEAMVRRVFRKGDIIAREGDILDSIFIIRSGIATIDHDGKELLTLSPGDWFGEGGLLTGMAETGTIKALTAVVAFEISQSHVASILMERPAIADELSAVLAKRLETERKLLAPDSAHKPAISLANRIRELFNLPNR